MKRTRFFLMSFCALCVLALSASYLEPGRAQGTIIKGQPKGQIKTENKANVPHSIETVVCPEWLTVKFDQSQTPDGWKSYSSYATRATEAVVGKGAPGRQILQCVYGAAVLEREVPANSCKATAVTDGTKRSFQCSW